MTIASGKASAKPGGKPGAKPGGYLHQPMPFTNRAVAGPIWPSVAMFVYGAGWSISFDWGVRVYAAELITLLGLVVISWFPLITHYKALQGILLAYAGWIVAIIVSDLVNDVSMTNTLKNMATPAIGGASLIFVVAVLYRQPSAILAFLLGTVIFKGIFGDATYGDTFADVTVDWANIQADTNLFKVRVDPILTPALVLISCYLARSGLYRAALFLGLAAAAYFALDSRSTGLVLLAASVALFAIRSGYRPKLNHVVLTILLVVPFLYAAYFAYVDYTLTYNPGGHNGKQLALLDNPYNPFALLLTARSEWLIWPVAFSEKPLFGWGSWAIDPSGRFQALRAYLLELEGPNGAAYALDLGFIPVHSVIGAALVWSGTLGLLALAFLFRTIMSLIMRLHTVHKALLPVTVFLGFTMMFHFFFSPPQHVRLSFPIALGLLIVTTSYANLLPSRKADHPYRNGVSKVA